MSGVRTRPPHDRPARGKSGPERFLREIIGRRTLDFEAAARAALAPRLARREGRRFGRAWLRTLRLLRPLGAVSQGNRIEVLCDGDHVFEAMWRAIGEARHSVFLDIYIFDENGDLVAMDDEPDGMPICRFTPPRDGRFVIAVVNADFDDARYNLWVV